MKLLFVVEQAIFIKGYGLLLAPGMPRGGELEAGTPLFMVRPDGTHVTAMARPLPTRDLKSPTLPVAVDLLEGDVPEGTRVFGRDQTTH
jgi:hypothetical protein